MSITKNIQMSEFNRTDYDILLPQTRLDFELGNEYVWEKMTGMYVVVELNTATLFLQDRYQRQNCYIVYSDNVKGNDDGTVALSGNIQEASVWSAPNVSWRGPSLNGKYFQSSNISIADAKTRTIYLAAGEPYESGDYLNIKRTELATMYQKTSYGYVNSPDPNAYPPAVSDGYIYTPLGQLGDKVRIAMGQYIGTGTYGASHPNSLTFAFEPKILYIKGTNDINHFPRGGFIWVNPSIDGIGDYSGGSSSGAWGHSIITWGKTVTWYSDGNDIYQVNYKDTSYTYFALG